MCSTWIDINDLTTNFLQRKCINEGMEEKLTLVLWLICSQWRKKARDIFAEIIAHIVRCGEKWRNSPAFLHFGQSSRMNCPKWKVARAKWRFHKYDRSRWMTREEKDSAAKWIIKSETCKQCFVPERFAGMFIEEAPFRHKRARIYI